MEYILIVIILGLGIHIKNSLFSTKNSFGISKNLIAPKQSSLVKNLKLTRQDKKAIKKAKDNPLLANKDSKCEYY